MRPSPAPRVIVAVDRVAGEARAGACGRGDRRRRSPAPTPPRPPRRSATLTDGGPDTCFEAIGLPATIEPAIACLPTGGTALPRRDDAVRRQRASFEPFPFVDGGRRILGSNYGSADPAVDFPRYAALHLAGRLPADRLVTARIGLDDVEDAFDAMRRGEGVRSIVGF